MILIEEANTRKNVFYKYFIDNEYDKKTFLKNENIEYLIYTISETGEIKYSK